MSTRSEGGEGEILQNEVLTVKEVATYLRVSRVTVWRWCQQGIMPASQVGRNWRIRRNDLLDLLEVSQPPACSDDNSSDPVPAVDGKEQPLTSSVSEQLEAIDCEENSISDVNLNTQKE